MLRRNLILASISSFALGLFSKEVGLYATDKKPISGDLGDFLSSARSVWPNLFTNPILSENDPRLESSRKCLDANDYFFHKGILVTKYDVFVIVSRLSKVV